MGPIMGVAATAADLPAGGAAQGDLYYVENDGLYTWDAVRGWTRLDLMQGPRGVTGATGATGATGEQGATGSAATAYTIIPFSSGEAPLTYATNGEPSGVSLLGFGYGDQRLGTDYSIDIDPSDQRFSLTSAAGNDNKQVVFSLPFNASIRSISIAVGNWGSILSSDHEIFPYVQLFSAEAGSNNFTPLPDAFAIPAQGIGPGTNIPADTIRSALKDGLDIKLSAGTRIGIGAMMRIPGHTGGVVPYFLYFTGGIGISYDPM